MERHRSTKTRRTRITETRTVTTTEDVGSTTVVTEIRREEQTTDGNPLADALFAISEQARRARSS